MHLVGIQNIGLVTGKHEMENFKIADEILASLESLYSTQCTVCSSILTLLTVYSGMNNYKRSLRLKFSIGYIHKDEGLQIHLQTFCHHFSGGPNEVSSYLSRGYHRQTAL